MELFYRELGSKGTPTIILHGLYGSSDNWLSIAKQLQNDYKLVLVDLRNHGKSGHSDEMTFNAMVDDLHELFEKKNLKDFNLIGHSMGGKVAMRFALNYPEFIQKLVILDIAPKSYASFSNFSQNINDHGHIINSLLELNLHEAKSRNELDKALSQNISSERIRQFLLKNIERDNNNEFHWRLNIKALKNNLPEIMDGFSHINTMEQTCTLPTLFISGENSNYFLEDDPFTARKLFPNADFVRLPNAGHWIHADQPELLIKTLNYFLLDEDNVSITASSP